MSVKLKTNLTIIALLVMNCCYAAMARGEERVEFNTDVLDASDRTRIDLSRFATDNYVTPGDYLLDIRRTLNLSFGFGGANAALILEKHS